MRPMEARMRSFVVTGVSTGIGNATARVLAGHGAHVFGSVRREHDAARLADELGASFTPLVFDVTDAPAVQRAADAVRARLEGATLAGLVNNAGIAVPGPLVDLDPAELRRQLEVNVVGMLGVTRAFVPLLGGDRSLTGAPGRIVNIGSALGKIGMPFVGAYSTSKFAVEGFSECLRRELVLYGIDVIVVAPGAVVTPIWDKAEAADTRPFQSSDFAPALSRFGPMMICQGRRGVPAETVGHVVRRALTARRPRVRYAVQSHPFRDHFLPRLVPARVLDRLIGRAIGLGTQPWRPRSTS
jgi:NAD(P)-dependent dehydrogenase (short-subunit alcohol dehydrogenase family)